MPDFQIQHSQRFTKAAQAERDRLERQRERLRGRRDALQAKLDDLDKQLEATATQLTALEEVTGSGAPSTPISEDRLEEVTGTRLRGAKIRDVAVPLLIRTHGSSPIHYRDWYELLTRKGYTVVGKRPDAVFLNQVSRSPLVRATTKSGYYIVETKLATDLRSQIGKLHSQLASALQEAQADGALSEANRKKQRELTTAIGRTERELTEAERALEAAKGQSEEADRWDEGQPHAQAA